ncbi:MAG: hypothetical protein NVV83_14270 [Afipia sp.]|nr:hypothetical protein [Afipia sp.]
MIATRSRSLARGLGNVDAAVKLCLADHRSLGDDLEDVLEAAAGQLIGEGLRKQRDARALRDFRHGKREGGRETSKHGDNFVLRNQALCNRGCRGRRRCRVGDDEVELGSAQSLDTAGGIDLIDHKLDRVA